MPPQLGGLSLDFFDVVAEELGDSATDLRALSSRSRSRRSISDQGLPLLTAGMSAGGFLRRYNIL
jgi:hypothetical protein